MQSQKVVNPLTGRQINVGGNVYNTLIAQGYKLDNGKLENITVPTIGKPEKLIVPGTIPTVGDLEKQLATVHLEEDQTRMKVCNICKEYYMDRTTRFDKRELENLRKFSQACVTCARLCDNFYSRQGITNSPNCIRYKNAVASASRQIVSLESEQAAEQIRLGFRTDRDVSHLFPKPGGK